jgi:hypothetical protein
MTCSRTRVGQDIEGKQVDAIRDERDKEAVELLGKPPNVKVME